MPPWPVIGTITGITPEAAGQGGFRFPYHLSASCSCA